MQPQSAPSDCWEKKIWDILTPPLGATTCPWPGVGNPPVFQLRTMATVEVFSRSDKPGCWCPIKGQVQCIQSKHTIIVLQPKPTKQQIYSHSVLNLPSCFFLTTRHAHWLLYSNKKLSISILSYPAIQILGSSATLKILYSGALEQSCWLNCDFAKNSPIHSVMCKTNIGEPSNRSVLHHIIRPH